MVVLVLQIASLSTALGACSAHCPAWLYILAYAEKESAVLWQFGLLVRMLNGLDAYKKLLTVYDYWPSANVDSRRQRPGISTNIHFYSTVY